MSTLTDWPLKSSSFVYFMYYDVASLSSVAEQLVR
jgi:hypothetical protein